MAHNVPTATRSARALTLQAAFPSSEHRDSAERHRPFRHHRQHHSQQISPRDAHAATLFSSGLHLSDLLSPSTGAVNNFHWPHLRSNTPSPAPSIKAPSREASRERRDGPRSMPKYWTWEEVKDERHRNQRREKTLRNDYARVANTVQEQSRALNSLQGSLDSTLAAAGKLLLQLRGLYTSSTRSLQTLTDTSIPNLTETSETHLAALQRAHVSNSISQLATLKTRIANARERAAALQRRVENCAQRVAVEEERERAELRRHKRRVGLAWALVAGLLIAWIASAFWGAGELKPTREMVLDPGEIHRGNRELRETLQRQGVEWALDERTLPHANPGEVLKERPERRYGHADGDDVRSSAMEGHGGAEATGVSDDMLDQIFGSL